MTDASKRGRRARLRGQEAEREFCALATDALGQTYKRRLGQEREGGGDVQIGPFLVEIKNHKVPSERAWWRQACANAKAAGLIPALAYKLGRRGWVVVTPIPAAWAAGNCWREELRYADRNEPDGFFFKVREFA